MTHKIISISPHPDTVKALTEKGISRTRFFNQAWEAYVKGEWKYDMDQNR